ncbi:hypothetical protein [Algoriphagus sp.]|uniref:hypothetical protein n=1 Tax=Algoriphagus sp. TaxID=1872435 RepID=UPI003F72AD70
MKLELKHGFYLKPKKEQAQIQILIGFFTLLLIIGGVAICWKTSFWLPFFFSVPILLSVVAPFFDVPALKKSGDLIYYSALFLAEKPKNGKITIHGGSLFDYVFVIGRNLDGKPRTNLIIQQYLEGLIKVLDHHSKENPANFTIRGTSYILNERTARKIGFQIVQTDFLQRIILIFNYFNLMLTYSIAKGKWSWPSVVETKTFEANLFDLMEKRDFIQKLKESLEERLSYSD